MLACDRFISKAWASEIIIMMLANDFRHTLSLIELKIIKQKNVHWQALSVGTFWSKPGCTLNAANVSSQKTR